VTAAGRGGRTFGAALGAFLVSAGALAPQSPPDRSIALIHANVVDVEQGRILSDQTVLTAGGQIVSVTPSGPARWPTGTQVVNIARRFVIPGLWDMHVHQQGGGWYDSLGTTSGARRDALTYFRTLFLAAGVTGVREMGGDLAALLAAEAEAGRAGSLRPRMVLTGEKLGQRAVVPGAPTQLDSDAEVTRAVRMLREAGAAHVKLAPGLAPAQVLAVLDACRAERMRCAGHAPGGMRIDEAAARGLGSLEHLFGFAEQTSSLGADRIESWRAQQTRPTLLQRVLFKLHLLRRPPPDLEDSVLATHDSAAADRLFRRLASADLWVTPTLTLAELIVPASPPDRVARDQSLLMHPLPGVLVVDQRSAGARARAIRTRALNRRLVRGLSSAGVGLLAGTDTPLYAVPGYSLHGELVLLEEAGLTPLQALRTATLEPARYLRATDSLGSVAAGRVADLVVLRGDPLAGMRAIREVEMVMTRGRLLRRQELDALVRQGGEALARVRTALGRTGPIAPQ
jgi:imidazolonepropionase-like amidohydrolase